MKIKELTIRNYKSIKDISIKNPNPFTVFVGPNAAGKSNIFDALEFYTIFSKSSSIDNYRLFGEIHNLKFIKTENSSHFFNISFEKFNSSLDFSFFKDFGLVNNDKNFVNGGGVLKNEHDNPYLNDKSYKQFYLNFSRIFVGNQKIEKFAFDDDKRLSLSCGNLEAVLKRILKDETKKEEISQWLELLIPEFKSLDVKTEELSGSNNLIIYENALKKPITKKIISDGTYNIIAILTALYQSDEPQFLCIEEPENGLNPKVVRELVTIFRQQCEEKGHFIWLNTHSQSIVSELTNDEIILVDKIEGETKIKQIQGVDLHGMKMDEALFTNAIGGGIPW